VATRRRRYFRLAASEFGFNEMVGIGSGAQAEM
jgi:hypothetical protein